MTIYTKATHGTLTHAEADSNMLQIQDLSGDFTATGNITAYYSDDRLKIRTGNIENPLDKVKNLNGFNYIENSLAKSFGYDNDENQVGVSAQEVQKVLPEALHLAPFDMDKDGMSKSGERYLTVHYEKLVPLLVEAIKELSIKVEQLENK